MGEVFIDMTKGVGIFLIAGQTILHFAVGKQYEKYIKLIISLMVAAQIVSGFSTFFNANGKESDLSILQQFRIDYYENWEKNQEDFQRKLLERQEELEQSMMEQQDKVETAQEENSATGNIVIEKIEIGEKE